MYNGVSGPTIAEDKELLECTQNPLLLELRKERERKGMDGGGVRTTVEKKFELIRNGPDGAKITRYLSH